MNELIKKGSRILVVVIAVSILFSDVGTAANLNDPIGTYKSITAYSNGPCVAKYSGIYEGIDCSLPKNYYWQCVEYVKRFYRDALLVDISKWSGDAGTYYGSASAKGLMAFPNRGSERPKPNDILAFSGGPFGYGHVAIITEVGDTYVKVIEQNWARNDAIHQITYNKATNLIGDSNGNRPGSTSYHIQGWLRKEQIELTYPNGIEVWNRFTYQTVKWKYFGDPGSIVKIELLKDSTVIYSFPTSGTISIGSNGVGSYTFYLGTVPTGYGYQVRITSSKGFSQSNRFYTDISDNKFYVQ